MFKGLSKHCSDEQSTRLPQGGYSALIFLSHYEALFDEVTARPAIEAGALPRHEMWRYAVWWTVKALIIDSLF